MLKTALMAATISAAAATASAQDWDIRIVAENIATIIYVRERCDLSMTEGGQDFLNMATELMESQLDEEEIQDIAMEEMMMLFRVEEAFGEPSERKRKFCKATKKIIEESYTVEMFE